MSNIALSGHPSGTGTFTIEAPNSNSNVNFTLPTTGGQLQTNPNGAVNIDPGAPANSLTVSNTGVVGGNGGSLTALNASNLSSGTVPDARFPATLPAASGANLTSLNASNLSTGTVATARLGSGTANSSTFLRGDNTWAAAGGAPANWGDIGSIMFAAVNTTSNLAAGTTIAGSNLLFPTTVSVARNGTTEGTATSLPRSFFSLGGSYTGAASRINAGNTGFILPQGCSTLSGTWRLMIQVGARFSTYDANDNITESTTCVGLVVRIA